MKLYPFVLAARLLWAPNTEPDLSHYIVYSGSQSGTYDSYQTTQDTTFSPLENGRFYAVRAVDSAGNVSGFSTEVQYQVNAMDTLLVGNALYFEVEFTEGRQDTGETWLVEHRLHSPSFQGQWLSLFQANNDFWIETEPAKTSLHINVERIRSFLLNDTANWLLEIRVRLSHQVEWITHDETLKLGLPPRLIKSITPFNP